MKTTPRFCDASVTACLLTSAALALALANPHPVRAQTYQEPYRPQYHYTPAKNWINDPNGLVDYQGEHHMFYQYNPFGTTWANTISWGHAVSTDWVHWKELPVDATPSAERLVSEGRELLTQILAQVHGGAERFASAAAENFAKHQPNQKWVLVVNVNPGSVGGGSGAQYFVGNFDGKQFTADDIIDPTLPSPGIVFQNWEGSTTFAGWDGPPPGTLWVKGQ